MKLEGRPSAVALRKVGVSTAIIPAEEKMTYMN
jgi:hypothetical protein